MKFPPLKLPPRLLSNLCGNSSRLPAYEKTIREFSGDQIRFLRAENRAGSFKKSRMPRFYSPPKAESFYCGESSRYASRSRNLISRCGKAAAILRNGRVAPAAIYFLSRGCAYEQKIDLFGRDSGK